MSRFVLDASVALSWFVDVPVDPYAARVRNLMREGNRGVVPQLWLIEFANGLLIAERRRIISAQVTEESASEADRLRLAGIDVVTILPSVKDLLALARSFQLTAYDATYLELAQREALSLATLDRSLRAAARKAGIATLS